MIVWNEPARHWTPQEEYATGDVLLGLLHEGWRVASVERAPQIGRATLYEITLLRDGEQLEFPMLDCPAVHDLRRNLN